MATLSIFHVQGYIERPSAVASIAHMASKAIINDAVVTPNNDSLKNHFMAPEPWSECTAFGDRRVIEPPSRRSLQSRGSAVLDCFVWRMIFTNGENSRQRFQYAWAEEVWTLFKSAASCFFQQYLVIIILFICFQYVATLCTIQLYLWWMR